MSLPGKLKVLFDECVTRGTARTVAAYLRNVEQTEGHFLLDLEGAVQGMQDKAWPERFCLPPEEWIVISADAGRGSPRIAAKGPPLYHVLPLFKITGFFVRGKLFSQAPAAVKTALLIASMPEILKAGGAASPGTRFLLRPKGKSSLSIDEWPPV